MADLVLRNITKRLGNKVVIDDLTMEVGSGELVCLLGESGSGKTTTLRMIGGFIPVDQGQILIGGQDVTSLSPDRRPTSMVFQSYALWPSMNVFMNISYGLRVRRVPKPEIRQRVTEVMRLVGLEEHEKKFPGQLSGGQQQRVALARSLVLRPSVLLLDEPLSNLDAKLRERVREDIREIQQKSGITTVLVTHDQEEALSISDRVAVLVQGKIEQFGKPKSLYRTPTTLNVASFIGTMNFFDGSFSEHVVHIDGQYPVPCHSLLPNSPGMLRLGVRPEDVRLGQNGASGVILRRVQHGHYDEVTVHCNFGPVRAVIPAYQDESTMAPGNMTMVSFERILAYQGGTLLAPADEPAVSDIAR